MDANLGKPVSEDITPAIEIYNMVRERVEKGLARFLAISGNPETVEAAEKTGIAVKDKKDFSLNDFLK